MRDQKAEASETIQDLEEKFVRAQENHHEFSQKCAKLEIENESLKLRLSQLRENSVEIQNQKNQKQEDEIEKNHNRKKSLQEQNGNIFLSLGRRFFKKILRLL